MSESKFDYLVNVSEAAFQSMVIATIESFLVPGRSGRAGRLTRHRETFGLLWGYETTTASKARCFNVEVAITDANAERGRNSVVPSHGLETINKALPTLLAQPQVPGRLPQSPLERTRRLARPAAFLSDDDRRSIEADPSYAKLDFRVALLLNVQKLSKKGRMMPIFSHDNTLEFRLNDLRMSLAAWVACPVRHAHEPALYVVPRPRRVPHIKWKREPWQAKYRHLDAKRVWLNAPVHNFFSALGD